MDFGDLGENLPVILTIIGLILLQIILRRRRKPATTQQEIIESLLSEIRVNLRLTEVLASGQHIKRFITTSWKINNTKLDFLEQSVQVTLNDAFTIAEDFNQQMSASKKYKSTSYVASIDAVKLTDKLTKSKEELEAWLSNMGETKESSVKSSVFDNIIGKR